MEKYYVKPVKVSPAEAEKAVTSLDDIKDFLENVDSKGLHSSFEVESNDIRK